MRPNVFIISILMFLSLGVLSARSAVLTPVFMASAAVPLANGMTVSVSNLGAMPSSQPSINMLSAATPVFTGSTAMDFGTLTYDTTYGIYRPAAGFRVDVALTGGTGNLDVTFQYKPGVSPTGAVKSLGDKVTLAFVKSVWVSPTQNTETPITNSALKDVGAVHIYPVTFQGSWLTVYIGMSDGSSGSPGEPFTNMDVPGTYSAQLVMTGTVT